MKKNILKSSLISLSSIVSSIVLVTPCVVSCSSHSQPEGDVSIKLSAPLNYLMPGDSMQIKVDIINGDTLQDKHLSWYLDQAIGSAIKITDDGLISASHLMIIDCPKKIGVKCWLTNNPLIFCVLNLYAVPLSSSDFLGFENNEIECLDRYHKSKTVKLFEDSPGEYKNETNIDLFVMDSHPYDWTSFINFTPVFKNDVRKEMYFRTEEGDYPSIMWLGYLNGAPTEQIPDFSVSFFSNVFAYIDVTFKADRQVKLHLTFNLWQARTSISPTGEFSYVQSGEDDHHTITPSSIDGEYHATVFCPTDQKEGTYENDLIDIYIYRKKFEYLDFTFDIKEDEESKQLLNGAFTYSFFNKCYYERPIDHFPYYKISMHYSFDFSKMPTAEELEYQSIRLVSFTLKDPISPEYPFVNNGICYFDIEWI